MAAIKQIKVDGVAYDIKAKLDINGNDITTTYVKLDRNKVLSTEDFTTELKSKLEGLKNYVLPAAGTSIGGVKKGVAVANVDTEGESELTVDTVAKKINELLTSLRNAGIIATE